ncbi:MAG: ABC-2 transporter permease [Acetatifactor sp.]|nr:ABC-2 transporter permease [Acetatifactor sp.]
MKGLVLKDIYNVVAHAKSLILILVIFSFAFQPIQCVCMVAIICGSLISTTFSVDEYSKWPRFAMVMPITRKELVGAKYVVQMILSVIGATAGLFISGISGLLLHKIELITEDINPLLVATLMAVFLSMLLGSIMIPLLFKFGAEKARIVLLGAAMIPAAMIVGLYFLLEKLGIVLSDTVMFVGLIGLIILILLWMYCSYLISSHIFEKQDL